jgi:hypothetical protein
MMFCDKNYTKPKLPHVILSTKRRCNLDGNVVITHILKTCLSAKHGNNFCELHFIILYHIKFCIESTNFFLASGLPAFSIASVRYRQMFFQLQACSVFLRSPFPRNVTSLLALRRSTKFTPHCNN